MIQFLKGKKTYLLALAGLAYAIGGYFSHVFDFKTATELVWAALSSITIRAAISKV